MTTPGSVTNADTGFAIHLSTLVAVARSAEHYGGRPTDSSIAPWSPPYDQDALASASRDVWSALLAVLAHPSRRQKRSRELPPWCARVWLGVAVCLAGLLWSPAPAEAEDGLDSAKRLVRARFSDVPQLSVDELRAWLDDPERPRPILLDVRTSEEYSVSHLEGARRAETAADALRLLDDASKDAPVVAYCSVGYRSSALVRTLRREGYLGARNLEGSIFEWANRGHPVVRDGEPVREVHPYGWPWSRYLERELHSR